MKSTFYLHTADKSVVKTVSKLPLVRIHEKKQIRYTIAGVIDGNEMKFGISKCSPKDQFNRKLGRVISLGRATKHPIHTMKIPMTGNLGKVFVEQSVQLLKDMGVEITK